MVSSDATAVGKHAPDSMAAHRKDADWGVSDFIGKFHLSKMTTPHPIPGTATRVEQERNVLMEKRASSLKYALDKIETRRRLRVRGRTRKAAVTARVEIQATVGYRIDAGACVEKTATANRTYSVWPRTRHFHYVVSSLETTVYCSNISDVQVHAAGTCRYLPACKRFDGDLPQRGCTLLLFEQ